jgi:hemerythrin
MSAVAGRNVLLSWQDDFNVGINAVDDQHRRLVELINVLWEATIYGASVETLLKHIDELERYTGYHFADEEAAMAAAGYPDLESHRDAHKGFIMRVAKERHRVVQNGYVALDLVRFLQEWLIEHIAGLDKRYAQYVLSSSERATFFSRLLRRFSVA